MKIKLPTDPARSKLMGRVRQSKTASEDAVAAALTKMRFKYRRNVRDLPGSPDFANKKRRWAIFVNGCFWHHHNCKWGTMPKRNFAFWESKFVANRRRDAANIHDLRARGYKTIIIWECESRSEERLIKRLDWLG